MDKGQSDPPPPAYPGNQHGYQQPGYQPQPAGYPSAQPYGTIVVQHQPGVSVMGHQGPPPKDYFGFSIFTLVCCNIILGIIALIYAREARDKVLFGDILGAHRASRISLILNCVAFFSGVVIYIVVVALYVTAWSTVNSY